MDITKFIGNLHSLSYTTDISFENTILLDVIFQMMNETINKSYFGLHGINFQKAKLYGNNFKNIMIHSADFVDTVLEETNFQKVDLYIVNFQNSKLSYSSFTDVLIKHIYAKEIINFNNAKLYNISFENSELFRIDFKDTKIFDIKIDEKSYFEETYFDNAVISLHKDCDEDVAIKVLSRGFVYDIKFVDPLFGKKVREEAWLYRYKESREGIFEKFKVYFWKYSSNYGRSLTRWSSYSMVIATIFGFIYMNFFNNWFDLDTQNIIDSTYFTPFYYSIVTFTTLGFGDITPKFSSIAGQLWVTAEVIIGYIMLGGLISILANKIARRND